MKQNFETKQKTEGNWNSTVKKETENGTSWTTKLLVHDQSQCGFSFIMQNTLLDCLKIAFDLLLAPGRSLLPWRLIVKYFQTSNWEMYFIIENLLSSMSFNHIIELTNKSEGKVINVMLFTKDKIKHMKNF